MIEVRMLKTRSMLALMICALVVFIGAGCGGSSKDVSSSAQLSDSSQTTGATGAHSSPSKRPPQNDDYISTYGQEASGADRQAILKLVENYYAAAVADDGARACTLIYSTLAKAVPEDYGKPPGPPDTRGKTCAVVMSKFFKRAPGQPFSTLATTRTTGVRIIGDHAFVQLTSKSMPTGEISVLREGRSWKIETLIGEACKNCAAG
jgi:hypothetical protein